MAEYKNPQQEPGGDRRMLMVFAITFALIIISQIFLFKDKSKQQPKTNPVESAQSNAPAPQAQSESAGPAAEAVSKGGAPATGSSVVTKSASSEVETVVENDLFRIVFTNRGAQAKSWVLKKYKDEDGHPLDLVNPLAVKFGLPLSLYTYDETLRNQINSVLYVGSPSGSITAPGYLTYEYAQGDVTVRKTFQFTDTYVISVETEVTQNGKHVQAYARWPAAFGDQSTGPSYASAKIEYMANDKVERLAANPGFFSSSKLKVSNGNTLRGPFSWAGAQDQYFAAIFLPDNPDTAAMVTLHNSIAIAKVVFYVKFAQPPELDQIRNALDRAGLTNAPIQRSGPASGNEVEVDLGTQETSTLEQRRNTIVKALVTQGASTSGKADLNNSDAATVQQFLMQKDPLHLGGDAAARYQTLALQIDDFRNKQHGGILNSIDDLKGVVPPEVLNALKERFYTSNFVVRPKDLDKVEHYDVLGAAVGDVSGTTQERLFVGPKALPVLESVRSNTAPGQTNGPDLRNVVDFGFFSLIARPLFLWLLWTHQHMAGNWGVAIIILTVTINLVLLPLRITSMKSALKMQKLQPQMKAIQEKYKKYPLRDPRRSEMNVEIGDLYKREGANPAGGCLPLIIQMPFLFAFYTMLGVGIELRQAPFLWLHDLSSPDKLFVLPVLIVVTTYLVQKMTPNAGMDPKQQQMMTLMMPLMIGFFSYTMASGLSLYWTVGNVIAIGQQYIMNRTGLGREMRAEMEKRARKKASK